MVRESPVEVFRERIDDPVESKMRLHPGDQRFIVSAEVVENDDSYRILALGAAPAP